MSERELVYYIDPNNELWPNRETIKKYLDEYLDGVARLAKDNEVDNIICLTKYKVRTNNRFKFDEIKQVTLKQLMHTHAPILNLEPLEVVEFFRMGVSSDVEAKTLGINTLIKYETYKNRVNVEPSYRYAQFAHKNIFTRTELVKFNVLVTQAIYWLIYKHGKSNNPLHKVYELSIPTREYLGLQLELITNILKNGPADNFEASKKIKEIIYERIRAGS